MARFRHSVMVSRSTQNRNELAGHPTVFESRMVKWRPFNQLAEKASCTAGAVHTWAQLCRRGAMISRPVIRRRAIEAETCRAGLDGRRH
jgi:hypothetical protein